MFSHVRCEKCCTAVTQWLRHTAPSLKGSILSVDLDDVESVSIATDGNSAKQDCYLTGIQRNLYGEFVLTTTNQAGAC